MKSLKSYKYEGIISYKNNVNMGNRWEPRNTINSLYRHFWDYWGETNGLTIHIFNIIEPVFNKNNHDNINL
jgi:hypothetical protein